MNLMEQIQMDMQVVTGQFVMCKLDLNRKTHLGKNTLYE